MPTKTVICGDIIQKKYFDWRNKYQITLYFKKEMPYNMIDVVLDYEGYEIADRAVVNNK